MSFSNLKTRTKILSLVLISVLVALSLGGIGGYFIKEDIEESKYQYENYIKPIIYMQEAKSNLWMRQSAILQLAANTNPSRTRTYEEIMDKATASTNELLKQYEAADSSGAKEDAAKARFYTAREEYMKNNEQAIALAKSSAPDKLQRFNDYKDNVLEKSFLGYTGAIDELVKIIIEANQQHTEALAAASESALMSLIGIIIAGALILLAFGLYMARVITSVLNNVTDVALCMADNDLSQKLDKKIETRQDEFGDMGKALARMQNSFTDAMRSITGIAENIAASSEQLHANADQTASASGEVANATTTIMQSTEQAGKNLDIANSMLKDVNGSLENVTDVVMAVANKADETSKTSREGQKEVENAIASINEVGEGTAKVTEAVIELKESSAKISEIVEMITGIASQTNLLALNAAIEAARAGEHGRGFAVVAEEVRKLAEESGKAAQEIDDLIAKNNQSIQHTVALMDDQRNLVKQGVDKVNNSGEAFIQIASLVSELSEDIKGISAAGKKMTDDSKRTLDANIEVDKSARLVLSEVTNVSAAAEQQAASTQEIASSSQVLAQMAEDLNVIASRFKL